MKNLIYQKEQPVGLIDWLKQSAPTHSLSIGATCGCDVSRLGQDVCEYLNSQEPRASGHCRAFDAEELRRLAGDPQMRHSILAAAAHKGADVASGCDYSCTVRAIASLGGAILSGQPALEATAGLDHVFSVVLSHCERCRPESSLNLDPKGYTREGLAMIIGKRFLHWCKDQEKAAARRSAGAAEHANA